MTKTIEQNLADLNAAMRAAMRVHASLTMNNFTLRNEAWRAFKEAVLIEQMIMDGHCNGWDQSGFDHHISKLDKWVALDKEMNA